jgi:hypothetical protein
VRKNPVRLFHYTCEHGAVKIRQDDSIRPASTLLEKLTYAMIPPSERDMARSIAHLCWMTDLHPPDRDALGLTMLSLTCDRIAFCFEVVPDWRVVQWWPRVRRNHRGLWSLEEQRGALPAHWYVSEQPVKVMQELP